MALISPVLRNGSDGRLIWWCPGCDHAHAIQTGTGDGSHWGWNGNAETVPIPEWPRPNWSDA